MSKENFDLLLLKDFKATAHFDLNVLIEVLSQALLKGIIDPVIVVEKQHIPDSEEPWTERNEIRLSAPKIELLPFEGQEIAAIPSEIKVTDENGQKVSLEDPAPPQDRVDQDILLHIAVPFQLLSNNEQLKAFGIEEIQGQLILSALPFFSPSEGIGIVRYDFNLEITELRPTHNETIAVIVQPILTNEFYPEIITLLNEARFQLPDVDGLPVQAVKLFGNLDDDRPATLSIGLGGTAVPDDLVPLLDENDGLTISVSKSLFDEKVAGFTKDLPDKSFNRDENRWETLHHVKLTLGNGHVNLDTEITIHGRGLTPDATISIDGPIKLSFESNGENSKLIGDGSDLDVDLPWWLDLTRVLTDIFTLGFAEFGWGGLYAGKKKEAGGGATKTVAKTLNSALLSAFPSGMELFGKNVFMVRESAVPWGSPNTIEIKKEGLMLGGPASGGIKYSLRPLEITSVHMPSGTIRNYGFENEFYISKERTLKLWTDSKIYIPGVIVARTRSTYYLKDKPDFRKNNNLTNKPTFRVTDTLMECANNYYPPDTKNKYKYTEAGELSVLNP